MGIAGFLYSKKSKGTAKGSAKSGGFLVSVKLNQVMKMMVV
ncbi:hypothetical protein BAZMOX_11998_0 [methanotrophic endosymbiont of Bathymodiolus azoricus (Menez Gwen)]|nr:hypothetical protein BAZMOX_11998_0 [methanotrophic endosymbiont of Bathymodiolus azoricus (Menez Gwen)]